MCAQAVYHVRCMLSHLEVIFGSDTTRTIVSLKHLCVQVSMRGPPAQLRAHTSLIFPRLWPPWLRTLS